MLWRGHGEDAVDQMLKELDSAIVMGGFAFRPEIEKLLQFFGEKTVRKRRGEFGVEAGKRSKTCVNDLPLRSLQRPPGRSPPVETLPALEDFSRRYLTLSSNPELCVLKGLVEQWPAFGKWNDLEYLHERFGHQTVPVEVGQHYLAAKWGQKLVTVTDSLACRLIRLHALCLADVWFYCQSMELRRWISVAEETTEKAERFLDICK